ncbi:hypothetical protein HIM_01517 [Hirsutella minnesotensis 3608]|nr:hypothetical protein HIM_01517 [Hirsutella minnesotensis 3608]
MAHPHQRASSTASSSLSDKLPPYRPSDPAAFASPSSRPDPADRARSRTRRAASASSSSSSTVLAPSSPIHQPPPPTTPSQRQQQHQQQQQPPPPSSSTPISGYPSILQPRVAVVLKVPQLWHPWLFALRLCSILPALWWGLPAGLQLLLHLLPGSGRILVVRPGWNESPTRCDADPSHHEGAVPFALTEGALATLWCFACGYLSFFFTDCLMSRWLINYTPQATIVRLLSINAVNAYLTLSVLSMTGGFKDDRLLLPGWIGIATTLTVCYHITHQKINIRKETITSINVFSFASYITMITLVIHLISNMPDYPTMPIVARARNLWNEGAAVLSHLKGAIERAEL